MRKIVYTRADGGISVVHPTLNTIGEAEGFTEAAAEQRAFAKLPTGAIGPQFVDETVIPIDRTFRNAWEHAGDKVEVNMDKARAIQRDRLRAQRAPMLLELDGLRAAAVRKGDTAAIAVIDAKAQALADVTDDPAIDAAKTPEELKAAVPVVLNKG